MSTADNLSTEKMSTVEKNNQIEIARRFSEFFASLKLTQEEFSERMGVARSNISNWKSGNNGFSSAAIRLMEKEFRLNPLWLLAGEGEMLISEKEIQNRKELEEFHQISVYLHQNSDLISFIHDMKKEPRKIQLKIKDIVRRLPGLSTKDLERLEAYLDGMVN